MTKKAYASSAYKIFDSLKKDLENPNVDVSKLQESYNTCKTVLGNLRIENLKKDSEGGRFGIIIDDMIKKTEALQELMNKLKISDEKTINPTIGK